jgi:hypothetical protein
MMLEALEIYGMETVENAILAGLVTGDPVLLVGSHGAGKTLLCQRLALALGMEFWAYDAGKAMFEDVLGFPDPSSLATGQVEYVPTPISIWGKEFVLIDELSRANPSMQNKWLEVIRSRRVMGKELADLKYIFAAMNPPTYIGAHPLDAALAGRFAVIVPVPEVTEMKDDAVDRIVRQVSEDDAPMLKKRSRRNSGGNALREFVESCRERMDQLSPIHRSKLSAYVMAVNQFLASREIALDGRRLGMVWRSLQAYISVEQEKCSGAASLLAHEDAIFNCLSFTMPFAALGEDLAKAAIKGAHLHAKAALNGGQPRTIAVMPAEPARAVDIFMQRAKDMLPEERKSLLTRIISGARSENEPERRASALLAIVELATALCRGDLDLDPDDQYRLLSFFLDSTMMDVECDQDEMEDILRILSEVIELSPEADLHDRAAFLGFRLGCQCHQESGWRRSRNSRDENTVAKITAEVSRILGDKGGRS